MEILVLVRMVILILAPIVFVLHAILLGKLCFISNYLVQHVLELWKQIVFYVIVQLLIELKKTQTTLAHVRKIIIILYLITKYVLLAIIHGFKRNIILFFKQNM